MLVNESPMAGRGAPSASADSSVEGLVQSIQKSKNFKRLAGYSIECLNKLITPTASDWAAQAGNALRLGAVHAIVDVLNNPSTSDAGIFIQAIKAIATLSASSARAGAVLGDAPADVAVIVRAFVFYWDTTVPSLADSRKQLSTEDRQAAAGTAEGFANIALTAAKHSPRAVLTTEGALSALCRVVHPEYTPSPAAKSAGPTVFHAVATSLALQALTVVRMTAPTQCRTPSFRFCSCFVCADYFGRVYSPNLCFISTMAFINCARMLLCARDSSLYLDDVFPFSVFV